MVTAQLSERSGLSGPINPAILAAAIKPVRELWNHAKAFDFKAASVWKHVYSLFNGSHASTKEVLEDMFSFLGDRCKRDSSKAVLSITPQRLFFLGHMGTRWEEEEFPFVRLQQGDFQRAATSPKMQGRSLYTTPTSSSSEAVQGVRTFYQKQAQGAKGHGNCGKHAKQLQCGMMLLVCRCCYLWAGERRAQAQESIKPSGAAAEWRSIAAVHTVRQYSHCSFSNVAGAWVTCLLQQGLLYRAVLTNEFSVSLGCPSTAAMLWKVRSLDNGNFFVLHHRPLGDGFIDPDVIHFASTHLLGAGEDASDEYFGVPTEICQSHTRQFVVHVCNCKRES